MIKKIPILFLVLFSAIVVYGQGDTPKFVAKKVAMLEPASKGGNVTAMQKSIIRATLAKAITESGRYNAFTRTDVDQLTKEMNFQRSGMVNDADRKRLGEMSGADLICLSMITEGDGYFFVDVQLIDVENGNIFRTDNELMQVTPMTALRDGCQTLAQKLIGGNASSGNRSSGKNGTRTNGATYSPDGIDLVYVEGTGTGILATKSFYIGKYEVTQSQWQAIMGNNPSNFKGGNNPVESVSWNDVQEFLKKLNAKTGRDYRLPTEAEWEYAAREGKSNSNYEYSGSNAIGTVAWYSDNSGSTTHPVGQKSPNALGIYDMSGNVWEWCQDCYDSSCSGRVGRGGSWYFNTSNVRVSYRCINSPGNRIYDLGFRVVLSL